MGKEKAKKRRKSVSDDSSASTSSDSEKEKKKLKKLKKKLKKEQKKTEKVLKRRLKEEKRRLKRKRKEKDANRKSDNDSSSGNSNASQSGEENNDKNEDQPSADIPLELMEKSKAMAPMTKEEWEKRQSVVRRVVDEETGRHRLSYHSEHYALRLIKGDGEVLEEIVSRERHRQINKQATQADGAFYQSVVNKDSL